MKAPLPVKVKLSYGVGDFGTNLVSQVISMLYLFYLTNVFGLAPALAGIIMFVSKAWDAVTDPIMGSIVDATRSPWGRKRPYLLFGAVPMGLSFILMFWNPGIVQEWKFLYALLTYVLFCTALTVVNIPYSSLTVSITHDPREQARLTHWRMTFALVGTLVAGILGPVLINNVFGGGSAGHVWTAVVLGSIMIIVTLWTFFGVREVAVEPSKAGLLANIKSVFINKPFLILAGSTFLIFTSLNIMAGIVKYYFHYYLALPGQEAIGLGVAFVSAVLYMGILNHLSFRIGKKETYLISMGFFVAGLIGVFFFGSTLVGTVLCFLVVGFGVSGTFLMPWAMVAETIEYSEWHSGVRPEGAIYGYFLFTAKLAASTAALIMGVGLQISGYKEAVDGVMLEQSPGAIHGIQLLLTLVPAALIVLGSSLLFFYGINAKNHAELVEKIRERKASQGA